MKETVNKINFKKDEQNFKKSCRQSEIRENIADGKILRKIKRMVRMIVKDVSFSPKLKNV